MQHFCREKSTWDKEKAVRDGVRCFFKETKMFREETLKKVWEEGFTTPKCRTVQKNCAPSPTNFIVWKEETKNETSNFYWSIRRKRNLSP